jgi:hypothetical protein
MSKSDNDTNASQSSAADAWLSQLSDPKTWHSMMNGMQPGMPADVVIKTGERSVLTYLTAPLTRRLVGTMSED